MGSTLTVIVNHNTPELTAHAVDSVLSSVPSGFSPRVVVVNAGCASGMDYQSCDRAVSTVIVRPNVGFGTANNIGVAEGANDTDAILLLNSDARLD